MREEQRLGGPLKDDSLRLERHNVLPRTYEPQSSLVTVRYFNAIYIPLK